jgi:uncharacterized protein (DUF433 family)
MRFMLAFAMQGVKNVVLEFNTKICSFTVRKFHASNFTAFIVCSEDNPYHLPKDEIIITTSPDRLNGTPVFAGTRVPVQTLIDYLEAGDSLDDFLVDFPSVSRELAIAVWNLRMNKKNWSGSNQGNTQRV